MAKYQQVQQQQAEEVLDAWRAMEHLVTHVRSGGVPARVAPTILCRAGEEQRGTLPVDAQVYCGADVEYSSSMYASGGLLFTAASLAVSAAVNANQRHKAEAAARPQWRAWGRFPAIVTNQRLLLMTEQWTTYELTALLLIEPNPRNYSVSLHFEGAYPLMLRGPWVPWATVVICATLFGQPWPPGHMPAPQPPVRVAAGQSQPPALPMR